MKDPTPKEYTYLAFISYKSEDKDWALWLKRQLQGYRLPAATAKKRKNLPQRCAPVFLDRTNLTPGLLDEGLRSEVQASKFLIVLCSRNAKAHPKYLDEELQYFLEGGGDISRVIPFIVDDCPRPEVNCFTPGLSALCEQQVIVGANVYDAGKRTALLKVVAAMLGIRREELESEDARRRRRNGVLAAALSVLVLAGSWLSWDYFRTKTAYFADYTEVYGAAEGVGALKKAETGAMNAHYVLLSSRGKVRELRCEDALGNLKTVSRPERITQFARAVYSYEDGALSAVELRDERDLLILRMDYRGKNTVDLSVERAGENGEVSSVAAPLARSATAWAGFPDPAQSGRSSVSRYCISYDPEGHTAEIRFAANSYNDAARDAEGVGGLRFERDELGRVTKMEYLSFTGTDADAADSANYSVTARQDGLTGMEFAYDEAGNISELRYLGENGYTVRRDYEGCNLVRQRFFTPEGEPYVSYSGVAGEELSYDLQGFLTARRYLGTNGESVSGPAGYAAWEAVYDGKGREVKVSYFDAEGRSVLGAEGYAGWETEYDAAGNAVKVTSLGTDGKPILNAEGFAVQCAEYDERGNVTACRLYGTEGEPVLDRYGKAGFDALYDAQDRQIRLSYLGTRGENVTISEGYAAVERGYDRRGNLVKMRYFGPEGEPVLSVDGCAGWDAAFDEQGNRVRVSYVGLSGESVLCDEGYAGWESGYDRRGNEISQRFFGVKGESVAHADGYMGWDAAYDGAGNLTYKIYYNVDESPLMIILFYPNGSERQVYHYGLEGMTVVIDCDEEGNPVRRQDLEGFILPGE